MEGALNSVEAVYFYYPRLVCVVAVRDVAKGVVNVAPVTWTSPLSSDPPYYGICLSPTTHTHHLVVSTGEFTINFLDAAHREMVERMGTLSGREVNKVAMLGIELTPPAALGTPTLAAAYFAAECSLQERHHLGDQTLLVGEVMHTRTRPGAFNEEGVLDVASASPLLYLGRGRYLAGR